jgi:hypothetical protein
MQPPHHTGFNASGTLFTLHNAVSAAPLQLPALEPSTKDGLLHHHFYHHEQHGLMMLSESALDSVIDAAGRDAADQVRSDLQFAECRVMCDGASGWS